jgi:chromosome segregation ATPase
MEWLRQYIEDYSEEPASTERSENVMRFRRDILNSVENDGTAALELVYQAVELVRGMENRASDRETSAQRLVQRAIKKLKFAERRVHSAEAEQRAALAGVEEANVRVQAAEQALEQAETRFAAVEALLSTTELRANTAESRANQAEWAIIRIEDAIRIHLLGQRPDAFSDLAAAA